MEAAVRTGKVRQLGISNVASLRHLRRIHTDASIKPAVVQQRFYADTRFDSEIRAWCGEVGIHFQSFLTPSAEISTALSEAMQDLADKYCVTPQVLFFRYVMDLGIVPVTATLDAKLVKAQFSARHISLTVKDARAIDRILISISIGHDSEDEDWITQEDTWTGAVQSAQRIADPLRRHALQLYLGLDRGGGRRGPSEVAEALGGKYAENIRAADMLVREAMRSMPLAVEGSDDLQILYEDGELLAVNKPYKLRCTPVHRFVAKSLSNQVVGYLRELQLKTAASTAAAITPYLAHRLDRTTSGVVLYAKTKRTAQFLKDRWPDFKKEYLAIVRKRPGVVLCEPGDSLLVEAPIGTAMNPKDPRHRAAVNYQDGKPAATRFTVVAAGEHDTLLLLCLLEQSGRTHQIRIHAAHAGFPLLGDFIYGSSLNNSQVGSRLALHAWRLHLVHPQDNTSLVVQAPLPTDLQSCMEPLRLMFNGTTGTS
eukprot:gnl/TRDRNA2_/TRDRNA2_171823_c0_seq2.p1 gnl/TRDRNA2_/TRDRNA2_171823_c0~~gnl/TRDRNA2_/TRDRNA2_171823_c0_seq2.p1  ORF type:complete len:550 (+),score=72.14 gnl/TRDRNA2_/TRDRNA2_171823_c0_seq2:205-1650(+)